MGQVTRKEAGLGSIKALVLGEQGSQGLTAEKDGLSLLVEGRAVMDEVSSPGRGVSFS